MWLCVFFTRKARARSVVEVEFYTLLEAKYTARAELTDDIKIMSV